VRVREEVVWEETEKHSDILFLFSHFFFLLFTQRLLAKKTQKTQQTQIKHKTHQLLLTHRKIKHMHTRKRKGEEVAAMSNAQLYPPLSLPPPHHNQNYLAFNNNPCHSLPHHTQRHPHLSPPTPPTPHHNRNCLAFKTLCPIISAHHQYAKHQMCDGWRWSCWEDMPSHVLLKQFLQ
jgi:hypothetical protein